jgi:hypothetical protein
MLTSISPLGEGARHNRWWVTVAFYMVASTAAASTFGATLGAIGSLLLRVGAGVAAGPRALVLAAASALAVATDAGVVPLPTVNRQVNEDWLNRYRGWVYGAGFGGQLGLGVATIVSTATVYLALAACLLCASAVWGAVVGAAFGSARAVPILLTAGTADHASLVTRHRRVVALAPAGVSAASAITALAGASLAATGLLQISGARP